MKLTQKKDILSVLSKRKIFGNRKEFHEFIDTFRNLAPEVDIVSKWDIDRFIKQFDVKKQYAYLEQNHYHGAYELHLGDIQYALSEGLQLFTWNYIKNLTDDDMGNILVDPAIEEQLGQDYNTVVRKALFRHI